ncbi:MAG TPA: hypothetical protein VNC61_04755 [Acidimicrobiales bacterium]|nr:hypothetical protein [Acidimicrobiales bacterium]
MTLTSSRPILTVVLARHVSVRVNEPEDSGPGRTFGGWLLVRLREVTVDESIGAPSTVIDEYVTGPNTGSVFEIAVAPNWTTVGVVAVVPRELAESLTVVVMSCAVTIVAAADSDTVTEMTSPAKTGNRNDRVPAAPDRNMIGDPCTHWTLNPALAAY